MSKTKEFYFNGIPSDSFVTDDTYQDFLMMQKNHQEHQELESLQEEIHSSAQHRSMSARRNNEFFEKGSNDLPF